jgi:hypothetical protein
VNHAPGLSVSSATPKPGSSLGVTWANPGNVAPVFLAFYSGLNVFFAEITDGQALVPTNLTNAGQVYAAVVSNNTGTPSDAQTLSGLAILNFPFDSEAIQNF